MGEKAAGRCLIVIIRQPGFVGIPNAIGPHHTVHRRLTLPLSFPQFFTGIALTICLVFFLIIFSDIAQTLIVPAMTSILGFTFIFGSYAANTFENAAFIFQQVWIASCCQGCRRHSI
jgi:hypothetical protein